MLKFLKELFFGKPEEMKDAVEAPYKVEAPTRDNGSHPSWHTAPSEETKPIEVKDVLDVNKDGKVDFDDVKAAVTKTRKPRIPKAAASPAPKKRGRPAAAKTATTKKAPAKKPGRKPTAMKATAKSKKT